MSDGRPAGWTSATLNELCELNPKHDRAASDNLEVSFVPMAAVSEVSGEIVTPEVRRLGDVRKGFTHFANGDVVWAKITPCMENGKSAVAQNLKNGIGCGTTEFHVLRSRGAVTPEYLHRFMRQESYRRAAKATMQSGVGQARVPKEFVLNTELPVPPLGEQKRIVKKIESLQFRSKRAREALESIPPLIEKFRQSVLASAFRGDLTKEWREKNKDKIEPASELLKRIRVERRKKWEEEQLRKFQAAGKMPKDEGWRGKYKEPVGVDGERLGELPEGWCWATVEELGALGVQPVLTGPFGTSLGTADFKSSGVPLLTIGCLTEAGIDIAKALYVSPKKAKELEKYQLQSGDLLFSRMASVGRAALVTGALEGALINYHIMRLRLCSNLIQPMLFVRYVQGSPVVRQYLFNINHGMTRDGINTDQLLNLPVPLPPTQEQIKIYNSLEQIFNIIREQEAALIKCVGTVDLLDQSILAKAFRGELVPQDSNDESASVLLERIKKERETQNPGKKKSTPKRKATTNGNDSEKALASTKGPQRLKEEADIETRSEELRV